MCRCVRIARHDGVLSAVRAHDARTLTEAARTAAPGFASGIYGAKIWTTPAPRVFHTLTDIRSAMSVRMLGPLTAIRRW